MLHSLLYPAHLAIGDGMTFERDFWIFDYQHRSSLSQICFNRFRRSETIFPYHRKMSHSIFRMINYDHYEFSSYIIGSGISNLFIHFVLRNVLSWGAFDDQEVPNVCTVSLVVISHVPPLPCETSTKSDAWKL